MTAIQLARQLIVAEEGFASCAYPDPLSDLGKAMVAKHGRNALLLVGSGRLVIPHELRNLDGIPWTIGYGQTGAEVKAGTTWTKAYAEAALDATLAEFDGKARIIYPGLDRLDPRAHAAILSLVYNRGLSLQGERRREMRELQPAILQKDYARMAALLESMCRLWEGQGMGGLIERRKREARMCREAGGLV